AQRHRGSCCPRGPGLPMGRIRALAIAVQRRGCHVVHRPSSPTLVRGRLRRAGKEASGSAVPFGESSLAPPSLLPSVVARLSLLPERSGVIAEHWPRRASAIRLDDVRPRGPLGAAVTVYALRRTGLPARAREWSRSSPSV